jgi:SAM-dependent methyltransferase
MSHFSQSESGPGPSRWLDANAVRLFACGLAALFWELVLIRWLGASIRIVAYFANLVLISAFFGLGAGALMTRFRWRLERLIAPLAALATLLGVWLGGFWHVNLGRGDELIWAGGPRGLGMSAGDAERVLSAGIILVVVYCTTALLFVAFGQYIGRLFKTHPPLRAYSLEVAGSLAGIGLFALLSVWQTSPTVWFAIGFVALVVLLPPRARDVGMVVVLAAVVLLWTRPAATGHTWSPYYRISVEPLEQITDRETKASVAFAPPVGHVLAVNTDFHQMMLDLRPAPGEHGFLTEWRAFYDAPYRGAEALPPGPILIVGAGTGNDVAAALRNTDRRVTAVEIDPGIAGLGRELHREQPYQDPRVTLVIDDARSFFNRTRESYAMVVFGLLDSHRLLSSFSSVRLDNFIYTRESMAEVRRLLTPGGRVALSFVTVRPWVHERLLALVDEAFDNETTVSVDPKGYANGTLFLNGREPVEPGRPERGEAREAAGLRERGVGDVEVPTDDWPFLYLRRRSIPTHNQVFLALALLLSAAALLLLPRGERRIRLPYFFLGAAFFLLETSNVVRMSLLYGSTWWVNTVVFAGILALVLLSNLTAHFWQVPLRLCLAALTVGILLAAAVPSEVLLGLPPWPRAVLAVALFLGPVYFGGLVFARLITRETRLFEAYGSNVLGAVLGGAAEYLSLLFGFRFLLALALAFYVAVFLLLHKDGDAGPPPVTDIQ